jgi:hypothetical protein
MPTIVLSPIVDRDGLMIEGANGVPLAADDAGLVYTLRDDGEPQAMGALDQDDDGRVILVPLPAQAMAGLGALDPKKKGHQLIRLASRRAHGRGRLAHWERTVARQRADGLADTHPEQVKALAKVERWKQKLATIQGDLERVNGEALAGDDDMAGLGASWWTRNRSLIGGIAAGAAGTALVGSALTKGTGANSLMNTAWKGVKGFFTAPGADDAAAPAAPAAAPARGVATPAPAMPARPAAAAYAMPMPAPAAPQVVQAGMGGMDMKTLLLVGGIGLGALLLLNRPKA